MLDFIRRMLLRNLGIKILSLILALILWFYVSDEINKEGEKESTLHLRSKTQVFK